MNNSPIFNTRKVHNLSFKSLSCDEGIKPTGVVAPNAREKVVCQDWCCCASLRHANGGAREASFDCGCFREAPALDSSEVIEVCLEGDRLFRCATFGLDPASRGV